ncbi:MAG TPA: cyclic peptide export ABC transporter [Reyranella sp.]|nr:cyclic peptide export ABC transporter [Reyranella sp.]
MTWAFGRSNIARLLKTTEPGTVRRLLFVTALAGLANALLLGLINIAAASAAAARPLAARVFIAYLVIVVVYFLANRASLHGANDLLQRRLMELRVRVAEKVRHSDLRALERIGRHEIYATLVQETNYLAQNFPILVGAAQSLFLVLFSLLYIATLSLISFAVIAFFAVTGLLYFRSRRSRLDAEMSAVHVDEAAMIGSLTNFTDGFQEIRLNADKNDSLFRRFVAIVDALEAAIVSIGRQWVVLVVFSNAFLYILLGLVVLALPYLFTGETAVVYKIVTAVIFCVGPISGMTLVAHIYARADVGLGHVYRLEERLEQGASTDVSAPELPATSFRDFRTIRLERISFHYEDAQGDVSFEVGPWDIELRRGEMVFLRGGNGSGKSTVLKLMCGLYRPMAGRITVDGVAVGHATAQEYRELFSSVFTDFHLFDRLYGLDDVSPQDVRALIERMELSGKVDFVDGRFSTLDLSTGQRKRLAMIASLLENREVYVFDEWAADQDAHFRDVFYTELLPELKRLGKTIVAVTHDDRYWHVSDRLITLDLGEIVSAEGQG